MRPVGSIFAWLLLVGTCTSTGAAPQQLEVLTRASPENVHLRLDGRDQQWLRQLAPLRIGVSGADYPPFEVTRNQHELEGLSADYADMLGRLLNVPIKVLRYSNRDAAMAALRSGELELLATSNNFERADPDLILSRAYAEDQPMWVKRHNEPLPADLAGQRIAVVEDYLSVSTIQKAYPDTVLVLYPSIFDALGAVAFGKETLYLGDFISANYLINTNYHNDLQLAGPAGLDANPFAFALARSNSRLKRIVDQALLAIPMEQRHIMAQRWSAGRADMSGQSRISLSPGEQDWLDRHPVVRVGANEDFAPLTFFDADGQLQGLTARLLDLISQRSGLTFEIVRGKSLNLQIEQLRAGRLDLLPVVTPSSERELELSFTRPYLNNPFVLVASSAASAQSFADMAGKRLAIYRGHPLRDYLRENAAQLKLVDVQSPADGMEAIVKGQADATVSSLMVARYLIARQYRGRMRIVTTVGDQPARIALATAPDAPQLQSILNKALLSISQQEMDDLIERWSHDAPREGGYWELHRREILLGFSGAALLLLLALLWIGLQRRQIRQRQQWLRRLQDAKDAADDANRAKTTFLATMSHELRTPLNAVIGMLELALKHADKGVTDRQAIEVASQAGQQLLAVIGDILDIARIESGHLSLAPERANLRELVVSVGRVFDGLARHKQLTLRIEVDALSNVEVMIDPTRFKQVISNLLGNAIKFTHDGEVCLRLRVITEHDGRMEVGLIVEDTGIGISAEDRQRLFRPFVQVGNQAQSARSGSGLGLVISRNLCRMMGGDLWLESQPGRGTQVMLQLELLKLDPLAQPAEAAHPLPAAKPLDVLVVDDHPVNRLLLCRQLSELGHRTVDIEDGEQGFALWRRQAFDVLITDVNMPGLNGYELALAVREAEAATGRARCLILGFTANAQMDERQRCVAAGMDDCLFKPILLDELHRALSGVESAELQIDTPTASAGASAEFDLSALMKLAGAENPLIRQLREEALSSLRIDLKRLLELSRIVDRSGLHELAHHITGGAHMIGADRVVSACRELERACSDGSAGVIKSAVDALREAMQDLAQQLQA